MVLRLAHDHILPLRITSYAQTVLQFSAKLNKHSAELQVPSPPHHSQAPKQCFSCGDASRTASSGLTHTGKTLTERLCAECVCVN